MSAAVAYARRDYVGLFKTVTGTAQTLMKGKQATELTRKTRTSPAEVIAWSGCKDNQTSADATEGGRATGAMSWAFITAVG